MKPILKKDIKGGAFYAMYHGSSSSVLQHLLVFKRLPLNKLNRNTNSIHLNHEMFRLVYENGTDSLNKRMFKYTGCSLSLFRENNKYFKLSKEEVMSHIILEAI